jgi:7-cyano-7-deazaguanine reductase
MSEELNLLGSNPPMPSSREEAVIETFANPSPGRDYQIELHTLEYTSKCPVTGQPDFGSITIRYIPKDLCIETKSLKFYLSSYRNAECFNETAVNWMLDDLVMACAPNKITVKGDFASRGGIRVIVEASHPDS